MKNRTELNLDKVFYVWLIYHIQDFWLNLLNGYDIYFWLRDTANQPYNYLLWFIVVALIKQWKTNEVKIAADTLMKFAGEPFTEGIEDTESL